MDEPVANKVDNRRTRLIGGLVLGLVVAVALVGSLFLFGRERAVTLPPPTTPTSAPALTPTLAPASPTVAATVAVSLPTAPTQEQAQMTPSADAPPLPTEVSETVLPTLTPRLTATLQPTQFAPSPVPTLSLPAIPTPIPTNGASDAIPTLGLTQTKTVPDAVPSSVSTVGLSKP